MTVEIKDKVYIDGKWCSSEKTFGVFNPLDGSQIGLLPNCGPLETEAAIYSSERAFLKWKNLTAFQRARFLRGIYELVVSQIDALAEILTREQGKPLSQARGEILYGASYLQWYAEEAKRIYGEVLPARKPEQRIMVTREPLGVTAAITPWNFPHAMIIRKMAAALAAGCTMVVKPASETPFSALAIAALCEQAKLPAGVFNVITGDPEPIAQALMKSKAVRKISFTGSSEVGRLLMRQSAETLKKLTLELGGNAPFIVFEDADIEKAVDEAIFGKFRNSGQTCICINRFLLHEKISQPFAALFSERCKKLKTADGMAPDSDLGPLISAKALQKIRNLVKDASSKGAEIILGSVPDEDELLMSPLILQGVRPEMQIYSNEIFGPVACLSTFRDEEQALKMANDTEYGLAAYFFTKDLSRVHRVRDALEFGMIGINSTLISAAEIPFGGIKQSGFGREGGRYGIDDYVYTKYSCLEVS
jgi:succinate-semialdehyde dehydrogenase/glutarate-semialdehyde dehydrogenase